MIKIVINDKHGGFSLSDEGVKKYAELKGLTLKESNSDYAGYTDYFYITPEGKTNALYEFDIQRDDPALVQTVELLGEKSWGRYAKLKVVEIPDDVQWIIQEYGGWEHVAEKHRTWH